MKNHVHPHQAPHIPTTSMEYEWTLVAVISGLLVISAMAFVLTEVLP